MKKDDEKQKFKKKGKIMAVGKGSLNRAAKAIQNKPSGIAFEEKEKEVIGKTELMESIKETIEEIERKEMKDRQELVELIDNSIKNKEQNIETEKSKESVKNTEHPKDSVSVSDVIKKKNEGNKTETSNRVLDIAKKKEQNGNGSKEIVKDEKNPVRSTSNAKKVKKQPDPTSKNEMELKNSTVNKNNTIIMRTKIVSIGDEMPNYFL